MPTRAPTRSSSAPSSGACSRGALGELPERERQILAMYYEEEMTMAEIGAVIGVCESRVSQLRSLALSRLRASLRELARPAGGQAGEARMSKILSQEEIDALLTLRGRLSRTAAGSGPTRRAATRSRVYNFRRPDRVSKDQIRSLHFLHDRFARNVATSLSAYLRAVTDVTITSVEQFTYAEFLMSLPDPTAFYALSMAPLDGLAALELNPNVAFSMIDRMLGGIGTRDERSRGR